MSLQPYDTPAPVRDMTIPTPAGIADPTGGRLVAWAEGLAAAHRIGTALCVTSFVPTHFRGKPEEAAAAILYGDEIGFTPTKSLQNLYDIGGKPAMYARSMVALVQSKGHEIWTEESTPSKVVVCGRRRNSTAVERSEWTVAKAQRAGYTSNKKYEQAPEDMLYARAASTVCRRIAADALAGIAYSIEEVELDQPETVTVSRTTTSTPTPVQRRKVQPPAVEAAPEPDLAPEAAPTQPAPDVTPDEPRGPSDAQRRAMFAAFGDAGWTTDARTEQGRATRLAYCSQVIGREVASTTDMTAAEVSQVVDALRADAAEEPTFDGMPG